MIHPASFLLFLLLAAPARADVVMSPTMACPTGSIASTSHSGEWCAPTTCAGATDCAEGFTCEPASICIAEETYQPGGMGARSGPQVRAIAVAACTTQADCPENSTCREGPRCVPASVISVLDPANIGCACRVAAARHRDAIPAWLLLLPGACLWLRRRCVSRRGRRSP